MDWKGIRKSAKENIVPLVFFLPSVACFAVLVVAYCLYSLAVLLDLARHLLAPWLWFGWAL